MGRLYTSQLMDLDRKPTEALSTNPFSLSKGFTSWSMRYIVGASSMGTIIEWYDFYIFGSLALILAEKFFPSADLGKSLIQYLGVFAAGFGARPFGALVFGRIGDLIGRKYAFLLTITIMGLSTTVIGLLPTYQSIGVFAIVILLFIRILQGLALGGEYGGAAIYVAEHAPDDRRGYWTSYIQTTATVGLFLSLMVILGTRLAIGVAPFNDWGWRIPFLLSSVLVAVSLYIRWRLRETPLFSRLKEMGKSSTAPLRDSLLNLKNFKLILLALLGATAGQAVVWYTGQFWALYFLQTIQKLDFVTSYSVVAIALAVGTPMFLVFGKLSDRIGRKKIIMAGCLLAAATYYPIYLGMSYFSNPVNFAALILLVLVQVVYVTMVYGPIAAFLVELFPARIRYTSLSLPYHLGNGWFGGFTPVTILAINLATGNIYAGLIYPIAVALLTVGVGMRYLKETRGISIWKEVEVKVPVASQSDPAAEPPQKTPLPR